MREGMKRKRKQSHPSRVRGLKYWRLCRPLKGRVVAPFTGAWIEMSSAAFPMSSKDVAPFTGAWIEIQDADQHQMELALVAPFTGAWIEMAMPA